jgi:hypothetical protein
MAKKAKKKAAKRKAAKKKPAKKKLLGKKLVKKKAVKKAAAKKKAPKQKTATGVAGAAASIGTMPRRENIPGIAVDLPDFADWRQAARALRVSPFFTGPDAVPFSRLRATQILDPMRGQKSFNDFFLE